VESHSNYEPQKLNEELDKIINDLIERIESMEAKELEKFREYIRGELNLEDSNLNERTSRAWNELYENTFEFNYKESLLKELNKITKNDLIEFTRLIFISQPKKLSVQLYGNQNDLLLNTQNIAEENYGILNSKYKVLVQTGYNFLKKKE
jgi:secreted Zn-dependent insulinase-like peptidase